MLLFFLKNNKVIGPIAFMVLGVFVFYGYTLYIKTQAREEGRQEVVKEFNSVVDERREIIRDATRPTFSRDGISDSLRYLSERASSRSSK